MIKRTYFIKIEVMPEHIFTEQTGVITCQITYKSFFNDPHGAQVFAEKHICDKHGLDQDKYYTSAFNRL